MELDLGFDRSDISEDENSNSDNSESSESFYSGASGHRRRHRSDSGESLMMSAMSGNSTDGDGSLVERARSDGGSEYAMDMDQLRQGLERDELFEESDGSDLEEIDVEEGVDEDGGAEDDDDRDSDTGTSTLVAMDQEDDVEAELPPPALGAQNGMAAGIAGNGIHGRSVAAGPHGPPTLTPASEPSTSAAALGAPVAAPSTICEKCSERTQFCACNDTSIASSDESAVAKLPLTGPSVKCNICPYKSKIFASQQALVGHMSKFHPEVNQDTTNVTVAAVRVPAGKKKRPEKKGKNVVKKVVKVKLQPVKPPAPTQKHSPIPVPAPPASAVIPQRKKRVRVPNKRILGGETKTEATKVTPQPQQQPPPKAAPPAPAARMSTVLQNLKKRTKSPHFTKIREAKARLNGRRRQQPKPRDWKCDICGVGFSLCSKLRRHKNSKTHSKKEEAVKGATSAKVLVTRLSGRGRVGSARARGNGSASPPLQEDRQRQRPCPLSRRQRPCPLSRRQLPAKGIAKSSAKINGSSEAAAAAAKPNRGKREMPPPSETPSTSANKRSRMSRLDSWVKKTKTSAGNVQPEAKPARSQTSAAANKTPSQGTVTLNLTSGIAAGTIRAPQAPPPTTNTGGAPQALESASSLASPPAPTIEPTAPPAEVQTTPFQQAQELQLDFQCIRCGILMSCQDTVTHSRTCINPRPNWKGQPPSGIVYPSPSLSSLPPPPVVVSAASAAGQAVVAAVAAATAQITSANANTTGAGVAASSKRVIPGTGPAILIPTKKRRTTVTVGGAVVNPSVHTAGTLSSKVPSAPVAASAAAVPVPSTSLVYPRTSVRINAKRERQRARAKFGRSIIDNSKIPGEKVNREVNGDPGLKCETCGTEYRGKSAPRSLKRHQNGKSHLKKVAGFKGTAPEGGTTIEEDEDDDEEMEEEDNYHTI